MRALLSVMLSNHPWKIGAITNSYNKYKKLQARYVSEPHGPIKIAANRQIGLPKALTDRLRLQPREMVYVPQSDSEPHSLVIVPVERVSEWIRLGRAAAGQQSADQAERMPNDGESLRDRVDRDYLNPVTVVIACQQDAEHSYALALAKRLNATGAAKYQSLKERSPDSHGRVATDVQATLSVLGRRPAKREEPGGLNLSMTKLAGATLNGANLRGRRALATAHGSRGPCAGQTLDHQ